jgi:transglutaminase-like putative cysteine protease
LGFDRRPSRPPRPFLVARFGRQSFRRNVLPAEALARGAGVCQDHTHVFIAAARHLGFPARYVSGYLQAGAGEAPQEAQHAWAEVRIPDLGWAGFDAANGISPDPHYVRVACGLDYEYAAPVRGSRRGGGGEDLDVSVEVGEAAAPQQQ